jgi:hypothetical protein
MLEETNAVAAETEKLWQCFIDLLKVSPRFCIAYLEAEYHAKQRDFWSKLLFVNRVVAKSVFEGHSEGAKEIEKTLLSEKAKLRVNLNVQ